MEHRFADDCFAIVSSAPLKFTLPVASRLTLTLCAFSEWNQLAAFTEDEIRNHWPIWDLFQNGGVVLFRQREILDAACKRLSDCGYQLHCVDCPTTSNKPDLLNSIVDSLAIPRYPSTNLDGFNDFISQIEFGDLTGVVISLTGFHDFRSSFPDDAFHILDILADNHRYQMLKGNRLLTLVQSDDPQIEEKIGKVGGYKPIWNSSEWLNKDRGL